MVVRTNDYSTLSLHDVLREGKITVKQSCPHPVALYPANSSHHPWYRPLGDWFPHCSSYRARFLHLRDWRSLLRGSGWETACLSLPREVVRKQKQGTVSLLSGSSQRNYHDEISWQSMVVEVKMLYLEELCTHVPPSRICAPADSEPIVEDSWFSSATALASSYVVPPITNTMTFWGLHWSFISLHRESLIIVYTSANPYWDLFRPRKGMSCLSTFLWIDSPGFEKDEEYVACKHSRHLWDLSRLNVLSQIALRQRTNPLAADLNLRCSKRHKQAIRLHEYECDTKDKDNNILLRPHVKHHFQAWGWSMKLHCWPGFSGIAERTR